MGHKQGKTHGPFRDPKKLAQAGKDFKKTFAQARTMVGKQAPGAIPRDNATLKINERIGWNFGAAGHQAVDNIRRALESISGALRAKPVNLERVDRGYDQAAAERAIELEIIYNHWTVTMVREGNLKARDATQMFAKGYGPRAVELAVRVKTGHGRAAELIVLGISQYLKAETECQKVIDRLRGE
jgi:hypothetical protein